MSSHITFTASWKAFSSKALQTFPPAISRSFIISIFVITPNRMSNSCSVITTSSADLYPTAHKNTQEHQTLSRPPSQRKGVSFYGVICHCLFAAHTCFISPKTLGDVCLWAQAQVFTWTPGDEPHKTHTHTHETCYTKSTGTLEIYLFWSTTAYNFVKTSHGRIHIIGAHPRRT